MQTTMGKIRHPISWTGWLITALELVLVILLALILARGVWFVIYGSSSDELEISPVSVASSSSSQGQNQDLSILTEGVLFEGRLQSETTSSVEALPETQLNLELNGVRSGDNPVAFIRSPQEGTQVLSPGETIAEGITLDKILDDRVIINRNGVREYLYTREEQARRQGNRIVQSSDAPVQPQTDARSGTQDLTLDHLLTGLDIERIVDGNAIRGYRITEESDPALLALLGLQVSDLIMEANDRSLTRTVNTLELMEDLAEDRNLSFTVLRNGTEIIIEAGVQE